MPLDYTEFIIGIKKILCILICLPDCSGPCGSQYIVLTGFWNNLVCLYIYTCIWTYAYMIHVCICRVFVCMCRNVFMYLCVCMRLHGYAFCFRVFFFLLIPVWARERNERQHRLRIHVPLQFYSITEPWRSTHESVTRTQGCFRFSGPLDRRGIPSLHLQVQPRISWKLDVPTVQLSSTNATCSSGESGREKVDPPLRLVQIVIKWIFGQFTWI